MPSGATERINAFQKWEMDKNGWKKHGRMGSPCRREFAENMMAAVKAGKIRKHLMGNTSPIRYGTMEKREMT